MTIDSGLLVVDKPAGLTSFQCVHRIRRVLGEKLRVGHCGTLDPMAEGVLLILFGPATRLQENFLGLEKQYWFRARWGSMTDTGDREGKETARFNFAHVSRADLDQAVFNFQGEQMQTAPAIAALKYKGRRYYEWARKGIEIPRASRSIRIASFQVLAQEGEFWEGRVVCSRGTYIRTLAEDVAKSLGSGAHLDALVRERVGPYTRAQALPWPTLETLNRDALLTHVQDPLDHHARLV